MNTVISAAWLHEHLAEVILLDATLAPPGAKPEQTPHESYLQAHIPGAVFFDIDEFSDHATSLSHMLPDSATFAAKMSALGISDSATVVVYEQKGVFSAPRAWWTLRTFGMANVHLLDGGLQAWLDAGYETEAGKPERPAAEFHANLNKHVVVDYAELQDQLHGHTQVLDARSAGRFTGDAPEPRPGLSSGHMPGATSMPFTDLVADGRMKLPEDLQAIFAAKHVDLNQPITTTCGSGVTAAAVALGLHLAGAKQVRLYDGSWAEYASRPESVIEKG